MARACEYVAGTDETLYSHFEGNYRNDPQRPSQEGYGSYSCDYQSVFSGGDRCFFRVQTGLVDLHDIRFLAIVLKTVGSAPPPYSKPEAIKTDELPSFIRGTRWRIFLEPYRKNSKDVISFIQYPTNAGTEGLAVEDAHVKKILCRLPMVSEAWMEQVFDYWTDASDYVQRILASYPM